MRRLFAAALALLVPVLSWAQSGSYQTKPNMQTEINTQLPDNTSGLITPAILRGVLSDMLASWQQEGLVNAQVGTSYTIVVGDNGKMVTCNNASSVTLTLPQGTGSFANFNLVVMNLGLGACTITPTTSTINGVASFSLAQNQSIFIYSDGNNYQIAVGFTNASAITNGSLALARIAAITADTYLGNNTGGNSTPLAVAFPNCAGASNALTYNTTTHGMGCNTLAVATIIPNAIGGLVTSNDGTTPNSVLDIATGIAADSTNAVYISLNSAFTKSTAGAWTAGSGNNGMGNGLTIAASTWYDVCLANNNGTTDVWFDTSNRSTTYSQCVNRPSGISDTKFRRIASFLTNGSSQIVAYQQTNDLFMWKVYTRDVNNASNGMIGGTATNFTMTVPTGFPVEIRMQAFGFASNAASSGVVYPVYVTDQTLSYGVFQSVIDNTAGNGNTVPVTLMTNSLAQVRAKGSAGWRLDLDTLGWRDFRGQ